MKLVKSAPANLAVIITIILAVGMGPSAVSAQLPTTLEDFFQLGTQPDETNGAEFTPIIHSEDCRTCHDADDRVEIPIYVHWSASMKANSARDPVYQAALTIANQDAAFSGDLCIRCHAPGGWLAGRSVPTDGSALEQRDYDGVTCNFCHRMVDPVFKQDVSPARDTPILNALDNAGLLPIGFGGGSYVIEADDVRRGPLDDVPANYHGVDIVPSEFHTSSDLCGTCHDVSNPAYMRQDDGTYALNALGMEHPTLDKRDMFPVERTYSEWANSTYANGGVDAGGVFGGNHPTGIMRSCQDCHMPDRQTFVSVFEAPTFFERPDVPAHEFNGGNTWIPDVLQNLYPNLVQSIYREDSKARARYMLENAATLEVTQEECGIRVRVVNETGHKLPTGYPEGRRMWVSVQFLDDEMSSLATRGAYDEATAELTRLDTKVYEMELGPDASVAALTGLPEEPSFHFALNNKVYKDNRVPPRGFTNAAFEAVQAAPVGAVYEDGQYWDDTVYFVPPGATMAIAEVYYQTASKEYVTFLQRENRTNDTGDLLMEQWELTGRSLPVRMKKRVLSDLVAGSPGDADCDGIVGPNDYGILGDCVTGVGRTLDLGCGALDMDLDGDVDVADFAEFQRRFIASN